MLSIGLMSGTSMDGVDAALIETDGEQEIIELGNTTIDYPDFAKILFKAAEQAVKFSGGDLKLAGLNYRESLENYLKENLGIEKTQVAEKIFNLKNYLNESLNQSLSESLSENLSLDLSFSNVIDLSTAFHRQAVKKLLLETGRAAREIDLIGYHGQTVFHDPAHKITIQLGDGKKLAEAIGLTVINDFRTQDILAGGQGAPFAPIYHQALVARDGIDLPVIVLNCGGIANISVIKDLSPENLIGFDTGPGNGLIDRWIKLKTQGKFSMDLDGVFGSKGSVNSEVLRGLYEKSLTQEGKNYFDLKPPRSLDINDMNFIPALLALSLEDGAATLEAFTAMTIVDSLKFLPELGCTDIPRVWILAGGGWNNPVIRRELRERLCAKLGEIEGVDFQLKTAEELGWNNKAMEAQIFAYLAVRSFENKPLSFPSTTGVPRALSGGHLYLPAGGGGERDLTEILIQEHQISHRVSYEFPEKLLTTESPNPLTHRLSDLAQTDIAEGYRALIKVDQSALEKLSKEAEKIIILLESFLKIFNAGHCIYLTGCGSAARAVIMARKLFTEAYPKYQGQIKTVIAGGELVIIRAAEGFEDQPELGRRQLIEAGWTKEDLLVGVSASGGAGFVSGQIEYVLEQGALEAPVFFSCNHLEELKQRFASDGKTIFAKGKENLISKINFLNLSVGPMAVSGSTRMQAATVQLLVLTGALLISGLILREGLNSEFSRKKRNPAVLRTAVLNSLLSSLLNSVGEFLDQIDPQAFEDLTQFELKAYREGGYVVYKTSAEHALNILTDTTERSPTFNIAYFENAHELTGPYSRCRIIVQGETDRLSAISKLLGRPPEVLNWREEKIFYQTTLEYLLGYDLTENIIEQRKAYMPGARAYEILIETNPESLLIKFEDKTLALNLPKISEPLISEILISETFSGLNLLLVQIALKLILNMHSTLVAGALGLYHGNRMNFVRPSNQKLINRGIDLSLMLLKQIDLVNLGFPKDLLDNLSRAEVARYFYQAMKNLRPGESAVFKTRDLVLKALEIRLRLS